MVVIPHEEPRTLILTGASRYRPRHRQTLLLRGLAGDLVLTPRFPGEFVRGRRERGITSRSTSAIPIARLAPLPR
jgi:hypothetical protein